MKDPADITSLQARILEILWDRGAGTVGEVHEALEGESLARNTIGTVLVRMEEYGWLERSKEGREYVYRPVVTRPDVRAAKVRRLVRSLFRDDIASLMSHALEEGDWEEAELERIAERIARHRGGRKP